MTDCYDYKREEKSLIRYKSREDCIVKHLERRELPIVAVIRDCRIRGSVSEISVIYALKLSNVF
jgi:hypothetical protein